MARIGRTLICPHLVDNFRSITKSLYIWFVLLPAHDQLQDKSED